MLQRLRVQSLRCIDTAELELDSETNVVVGPNGSGKTTLLEGIFLLGRGRSFRTRQTRRLIQTGKNGFVVSGDVVSHGRARRIGVKFTDKFVLHIDGLAGYSVSEAAEVMPVHVVEPGVLGLIDGSPSERRRFIDWGVFHVEHAYLDRWREYRRVLGQRNAALRAQAAGSALDVWTNRLIEAGVEIDRARGRFISEMQPRVAKIAGQFVSAQVGLGYRSGWGQGRSFADAMAASLDRDRESGYTQLGPHRGDLRITMNDVPVRDRASRGQQKLIATALIIGQIELFSAIRGWGGVVLVDDPAAELDSRSLISVLDYLAKIDAQRIVTGLSRESLATLGDGNVFHVEQGRVNQVYNESF